MKVYKSSLRYKLGFLIREMGDSISAMGTWLQGSIAYREKLNRHRRVMYFGNDKPVIGDKVFIAPSAHVIGKVKLGNNSSIWYQTVVRGDVNAISIGDFTNIQDRAIVHVAREDGGETIIGNRVTIESGAIIHACTLEDECFIGVGATILDGARVEKHAMVAPGSVVASDKVIPSGQLWAGAPAKFLRELTEEEKQSIARNAEELAELAAVHIEETNKEFYILAKEMEELKYREDKLAKYTYEEPKMVTPSQVEV